MITNQVSSGHAPGHIREVFLDGVKACRGDSSASANETLRVAAGRAWNCSDILPGDACDDLDIHRRSTYAQAARYLHRAGAWSPSLGSLRRRAASQGLRLVKVPERSRWFAQYGPYMLADIETSGVLADRLDLDEVTKELAK